MSLTPVESVHFKPEGQEVQGVDLEQMVPIARIREHLKIDDIVSFTDDQLALYRMAAFEAAEQYSGFYLGKRKYVREAINIPISKVSRRGYTHHTKFPIEDDYVQLIGSPQSNANGPISVEKGSHKVRVPLANLDLEISMCCRPCASGNPGGSQVHYYTGFTKIEEVPAGVILGIMKYIAWAANNPGDEFLSVQNDLKSRGSTLQGTNNIAWASGALELWRQYNRDAV